MGFLPFRLGDRCSFSWIICWVRHQTNSRLLLQLVRYASIRLIIYFKITEASVLRQTFEYVQYLFTGARNLPTDKYVNDGKFKQLYCQLQSKVFKQNHFRNSWNWYHSNCWWWLLVLDFPPNIEYGKPFQFPKTLKLPLWYLFPYPILLTQEK